MTAAEPMAADTRERTEPCGISQCREPPFPPTPGWRCHTKSDGISKKKSTIVLNVQVCFTRVQNWSPRSQSRPSFYRKSSVTKRIKLFGATNIPLYKADTRREVLPLCQVKSA